MRNPEAFRQVGRLFTILHRVANRRESEKIGRQQLADACVCSIKTIQRDMDLLQEISVPIRYDDSLGTYLLTDKSWQLPAIQLAASDLLALAQLNAWFGRVGGMFPFAGEISAVLRRMTAVLTPNQHRVFEQAVGAIAEVGSLARNYSSAPTGQLVTAILQQQTIEMRYESRSRAPRQRESRTVDPYRLDLREGRFVELQAWCHTRQSVRTYAVDRISDLVLTERRFVKQAWESNDDGIVGGLRGGKPIAIDIVFDEETAPYACDREWSFKPKFKDQPDGSVRMRGIVRGTDGVLKELLRWGTHVRVLGGPELRERMEEEIRALAKIYEK